MSQKSKSPVLMTEIQAIIKNTHKTLVFMLLIVTHAQSFWLMKKWR